MTQCPVCESEKDYQRIGQHWSNSTSCDFPYPSESERAVFTGLWLAGATVSETGNNPLLVKTTKYKQALEWIAEEIGIWHSTIKQDSDRETLTEFTGDETAQKHEKWRWTSVSCPWLQHLVDASLTSEFVDFSPRAAQVFTSFRGTLNDGNHLILWYPDGSAFANLLADNGFDVTTSAYEGRSDLIWFDRQTSVEYLDWIGGPIPPLAMKFESD
jgi:hypothetical protein